MGLGITLAVLASLCFASGNLIEKWAVDRMPAFSLADLRGTIKSLALSPRWLVGAVVSVVGIPIQIGAYAHLPISVVQSISVGGVVILVAVAGLLLAEHLSQREWTGVSLAVCSLVLVSLSVQNTANGVGVRGSYATTWITLACTIAVLAVVVASPVLRADRSGFVFGCLAGALYGVSGLGAKGLSTLIAQHGWVAAIRPALVSPYPYLFFGCWAFGLAVFQVGIQRCRVGVVGSLSTVVASAFVVATGMLTFGEHLPSGLGDRVLRLLGFAGILVGTALVGWSGAEPIATPPVIATEVDAPQGGG